MHIDLGKIKINYETRGKGKPIVFLHGFDISATHLQWLNLVESYFQDREGWQQYYIDLPGMGKTPGADWISNSEDVIDILMEFINQLIPDQTITLAGYSYGGYLAQGIVYKKPDIVNGLCLLAPVTRDHSERTLPEHIVLVENKELLEELEPEDAEAFQNFFVVQNRKTIEAQKAYINRGRPIPGNEEFLTQLNEKDNYIPIDVEKMPQSFDLPSLIIAGRQDSAVGYQQPINILEQYPRATLTVLDTGGHVLMIEQKQLIINLIDEWLDRVEESMKPSS